MVRSMYLDLVEDNTGVLEFDAMFIVKIILCHCQFDCLSMRDKAVFFSHCNVEDWLVCPLQTWTTLGGNAVVAQPSLLDHPSEKWGPYLLYLDTPSIPVPCTWLPVSSPWSLCMIQLQPHPLHSTTTPIRLLAQSPLFISNPNFYGAAYFSWTYFGPEDGGRKSL